VEDLFLRKNLVFRDVDLLESLIVTGSISEIGDGIDPVFVVEVDDILNLESNSRREYFILPVIEDIQTHLFSILETNLFGL
jgi:hypothetical protein